MRKSYIFIALDKLTGEIREIYDVDNGLGCGCVCAVCHSPLEARQGDVYVWHFSHSKKYAGERCFEGATKLIKEFIIDNVICNQTIISLPNLKPYQKLESALVIRKEFE